MSKIVKVETYVDVEHCTIDEGYDDETVYLREKRMEIAGYAKLEDVARLIEW